MEIVMEVNRIIAYKMRNRRPDPDALIRFTSGAAQTGSRRRESLSSRRCGPPCGYGPQSGLLYASPFGL